VGGVYCDNEDCPYCSAGHFCERFLMGNGDVPVVPESKCSLVENLGRTKEE
jgi:hypothetical protein